MAALLKKKASKGLAEYVFASPPLNIMSKNVADTMIQNSQALYHSKPPFKLVMFYGSELTHYSAGGDLKLMADMNASKARWEAYFLQVSKHAHAVRSLPELGLNLSLVNGVACGGGMSMALFPQISVFTEKAKLSMPENQVGYFTDAGACYYFPRKFNPALALYANLTGRWFTGSEIVEGGIGTHFVKSQDIKQIYESLYNAASPSITIRDIEEILKPFTIPVEKDLDNLEQIEDIFQYDSLQNIFKRLEKSNTPFATDLKKWLEETKPSPLSMAITFHNMKRGKYQSPEQAFYLEYLTQIGLYSHVEFLEGVRAKLIDKDQSPQWKYKNVFEVLEEDVLFFENYKAPHTLKQFWDMVKSNTN